MGEGRRQPVAGRVTGGVLLGKASFFSERGLFSGELESLLWP